MAADPPDHEWILARERGLRVEQVDPKVRARYARLEHHLAELPDLTPPHGWQADVWTSMAAAPTLRHRRRAAWLAAGGALIAAALIALWLRARGRADTTTARAGVELDIRPRQARVRGDGAVVGDTLAIRVNEPNAVAFRVYRDAGPALAWCPRGPGCSPNGALELGLDAPGTLRVIVFCDRAPPPPGVGLDADLAAATRTGSRIITAPTTEVR